MKFRSRAEVLGADLIWLKPLREARAARSRAGIAGIAGKSSLGLGLGSPKKESIIYLIIDNLTYI